MVVAQHGIMVSTRRRGICTSDNGDIHSDEEEFTKFTRRMRLTSGSQGPRTHSILDQELNQYKLSYYSNNLIVCACACAFDHDKGAVSLTRQPCPYESTSRRQVEKVMDVFSPEVVRSSLFAQQIHGLAVP